MAISGSILRTLMEALSAILAMYKEKPQAHKSQEADFNAQQPQA